MNIIRPPRCAALFAAFTLVSQLASPHVSAGTVLANNGINSAAGDFAILGGGANNSASGAKSFLGGGEQNAVTNAWGFVGGGLRNLNRAYAGVISGGMDGVARGQFATLGGGQENAANGWFSTVGGGKWNVAGLGDMTNEGMNSISNGSYTTVGGGLDNTASGQRSIIGGGEGNTTSGAWASVLGGLANTARGSYSVAVGGRLNNAAAHYTFAAGYRARASHQGAFVYADSQGTEFASVASNSFNVRAIGGVRFVTSTNLTGAQLLPGQTTWTVLSDRESKTDFQPIKPREVLSKLAAMPVTSWQYKHDPSRRYIGPTSQDFMAAFHLGDYDKGINALDADGVTFAAIQGLVEELKERDKTIEELKAENGVLSRSIEAINERLDSLPPTP